MNYLMESPLESERLLLKSDRETSQAQLVLTGLRAGMLCVDAGGGAGFVTQIMASIVGPKGRVIMLEQSAERIQEAKKLINPTDSVEFVQTVLEKCPLANDSVDYIFCRFVFEYLKDPKIVFRELLRILKPGGKMVIGDLDHNLLSHYPLSEALTANLQEAIEEMKRKNLWDPYMGRKLYSYFHENHLKGIKVHLLPHHLFYGSVDEKDAKNWEYKIDQIQHLQQEGVLNLSFDIQSFKKNFMEFFRSPSRFSYSPLILVEGTK